MTDAGKMNQTVGLEIARIVAILAGLMVSRHAPDLEKAINAKSLLEMGEILTKELGVDLSPLRQTPDEFLFALAVALEARKSLQ